MANRSERRRKALQNARAFTSERARLTREKYGLKSGSAPLPGGLGDVETTPGESAPGAAAPALETAVPHDVEIGRAPGQLPGASPFEAAGPTRFRVIRYDENTFSQEEFADVDRLGPYMDGSGVTWIQMMGITDPQIVLIVGAMFRIPMLMQEDVLAVWSRPKIDVENDHILAIARAVRLSVDERGPRGQQISIVAAPGVVVSFHENADPVFAAVEKRIRDNHGRMRKWGAGYLLYALLDTIVDRMLYLSEDIEDAITELEDTILSEEKPDCELEDVYKLKRVVVRLARTALPMRESLNALLRGETSLLPDEIEPYLRDLSDHAIRAGDRVEHARMILQDLQEYHHTLNERRTSEIMRVLTVVTSIFIPLTFIVGVYGMNFNTGKSAWNMPELDWAYGYPMCWLLMLTVAGGTLAYFRKRNWL